MRLRIGLNFRQTLVLDIGSSNTVVFSGKREPVRVPSRIALPREHVQNPSPGQPPAAESKASKQKEKVWVAPVQHGAVVDVYAMELLLKNLLKKVRRRWVFSGFRKIAGLLVPPFLEEDEKSRMRALLVDVGFSKVELIETPFAAVSGCGLSVDQPQGQMVMDLGGGTMNTSVFSMGGLVSWNQEPFGGKVLDQAISGYLAQRYDVQVGAQPAEQIKMSLGSVYPPRKPIKMVITAPERRTELPKKITLNDDVIRDVLVDACEPLIQGIQKGFATVPPDLAGDIARNGITLTGGCGLLKGLPEFLFERTGLRFHLAANPVNATLLGGWHLLSQGRRGKGKTR